MSKIIVPDDWKTKDHVEIVSSAVIKLYRSMQKKIKNNQCPFCGSKRAKLHVNIRPQVLNTPNILRTVTSIAMKANTRVECKKCKRKMWLNFGPKTVLKTGTQLERENKL